MLDKRHTEVAKPESMPQIVQIPQGYELTAIPGWAYNALLRVYYFIPERQFVPRETVWIPELKDVKPVTTLRCE